MTDAFESSQLISPSQTPKKSNRRPKKNVGNDHPSTNKNVHESAISPNQNMTSHSPKLSFILKGVEWCPIDIQRTDTSALTGEGREFVAHGVYIKVPRQGGPSPKKKRCWWCRLKIQNSANQSNSPNPQNWESIAEDPLEKNSSLFSTADFSIISPVQHEPIVSQLPLKMTCKADTFLTEGQFCSDGCIKAYCLDNFQKNPSVYTKALTTLEYRHRQETNDPECVKESPPWKFLKKYGGHWSPQQYRENTKIGYTYTENRSVFAKRAVPTSSYYREIGL
jgi:hypothetical protein